MAEIAPVNVEEVPHSTRGASSAHRWLACPGSPQLIEKLKAEGTKVRGSSHFAAEGTAAHTAVSAALEEGTEAWEFAGMEFHVADWTFVVDEEMQEGMQIYLDFVRGILDQYADKNPILYVEKRLGSILHEDAWGTADTIILIPGVKLVVIDFKYGRGLTVEPDSIQVKYYGYLACENYLNSFDDVTAVELCVVQPRIPHPNGLCRTYETTPNELQDWFENTVIPGIEETYKPDAHLVVGEHCRFCDARDHCPALKGDMFEFNSDIEPDFLTDEELGEILAKKKVFENYFQKLEKEAFSRGMRGRTIPGFKIVRKKATRAFKDSIVKQNPDDPDNPIVVTFEEAVVEAFGDDAYQPKAFRTPPQIEKLDGGKGFVSTWAYKPNTGLSLAPESDPRTPIKRPMETYLDQFEADPDGPY